MVIVLDIVSLWNTDNMLSILQLGNTIKKDLIVHTPPLDEVLQIAQTNGLMTRV